MLNVMLLSAACSLAAMSVAAPAAADDRSDIVAVVQRMFDAMAAHDAAAMAAVMVDGGQFESVRDEQGRQVVRQTAFKAFIERIGGAKEKMLERMWNPEVKVSGTIATLTAPYDFHLDGKFSHCGIDVFHLAKTADGWKIAGGIYTVQREGCAPGPLGPVNRRP